MIEIIPAMDIYEGKCVRLVKGDYLQMTVYHHDPAELARSFRDHGIRRIHMVDLEGAKLRKLVNLKTLEMVKSSSGLQVDFGGGVVNDADIAAVFESGADQVTVGSVAIQHPDRFNRWLKLYGSDKIILGADMLNGNIAVNGWTELSSRGLDQFLEEYESAGVKYVLCTDISKDGMLTGSSVALYRSLTAKFPAMNFIASGGIKGMAEIGELNQASVYGVIIGKALYEGLINLDDLEKFIR